MEAVIAILALLLVFFALMGIISLISAKIGGFWIFWKSEKKRLSSFLTNIAGLIMCFILIGITAPESDDAASPTVELSFAGISWEDNFQVVSEKVKNNLTNSNIKVSYIGPPNPYRKSTFLELINPLPYEIESDYRGKAKEYQISGMSKCSIGMERLELYISNQSRGLQEGNFYFSREPGNPKLLGYAIEFKLENAGNYDSGYYQALEDKYGAPKSIYDGDKVISKKWKEKRQVLFYAEQKVGNKGWAIFINESNLFNHFQATKRLNDRGHKSQQEKEKAKGKELF